MVVAGLVGLPAATSFADPSVGHPDCKQNDARLSSLLRFFRDMKCPIGHLAPAFLGEADAHRLDWRLLPSLSFVESGGGKSYKGNNIFGWKNGDHSFATMREGIHFVAGKLSSARLYRGKELREKLLTYNTDPEYADTVQFVMAEIGAR